MSERRGPGRSPFTRSEPLKLYNSLTKQKEVFVPKASRQVKWYSCGPTVYDESHMGHARSYMSFDILRRILSDYFQYDVIYVMNITDIDDKIIKRARQKFLFEQYIREKKSPETIVADVANVHQMLDTVIKVIEDADKKTMFNSALDRVIATEKSIKERVNEGGDAIHENLSTIKDSFAEYLDSKQGKEVTDNSIFADLPRFWEAEFFKDMDALNIMEPTAIPRVSEYIPEIIDYIKVIVDNGLAYESNGSVYFNVSEFDKKSNHTYAKLVPEAYGDTKSLQEGEGDLCADVQEKKSSTDFALWKASKAGEPWWESPWGKGRPGWHIECSAMASAILGSQLDIHTGGVDLKFPHHDNELAQSEAHFDNDCWVRYFLHSGHLTISGCKMSKSLKNFVTIKDALKKYSARQLRFAFLLHKWNDTLDYSENMMKMAITYEKLFYEFFLNVKGIIEDLKRRDSVVHSPKERQCSDLDLKLREKLVETENGVDEALCDNIDTRRALDVLRECISSYNVYIKNSDSEADLELILEIATYVTKMLQIFGTIPHSDAIGFPLSSSASADNTEEILTPYLTAFAEFRHFVREEARKIGSTQLLLECDRMRDDVLAALGVRLEDREGRVASIKFVDREIYLREKEEKARIEEKKAEEKAKRLAQQAEKEALKKIPPSEMFKRETDKYSKFDEQGLPTHDAEGKELSKGLIKKLQKLQIQQKKKYAEYIEGNELNKS